MQFWPVFSLFKELSLGVIMLVSDIFIFFSLVPPGSSWIGGGELGWAPLAQAISSPGGVWYWWPKSPFVMTFELMVGFFVSRVVYNYLVV